MVERPSGDLTLRLPKCMPSDRSCRSASSLVAIEAAGARPGCRHCSAWNSVAWNRALAWRGHSRHDHRWVPVLVFRRFQLWYSLGTYARAVSYVASGPHLCQVEMATADGRQPFTSQPAATRCALWITCAGGASTCSWAWRPSRPSPPSTTASASEWSMGAQAMRCHAPPCAAMQVLPQAHTLVAPHTQVG